MTSNWPYFGPVHKADWFDKIAGNSTPIYEAGWFDSPRWHVYKADFWDKATGKSRPVHRAGFLDKLDKTAVCVEVSGGGFDDIVD